MQHSIATRDARRLGALLGASSLAALGALTPPAPALAALLAPQSAQVALGNLPTRAMWALESNDLKSLSKLAHSSGIRFSTEVHVAKSDKTFTPAQIRTLNRRGPIDWGLYDAEADAPFSLTWANFRRRYLWQRDFSKGALSYNTFSQRAGKMNNLRESYTDAIFVESFVDSAPYVQGKPLGPQWASLWMIWKREGKQWKLRGIAMNSQAI